MKAKPLLFLALFLFAGLGAFAQEEKMAAGAGLEWNMNSRSGFAGGAVLGFDYNLPIDAFPLAAGLTFTVSSNFAGIIVIEPAAMFRWYFPGSAHTGFFAQADVGAYFAFEDEETYPVFLGGLRGGYRLPFGSMFYAEPYLRIGYPFLFSIGAMAGIRF